MMDFLLLTPAELIANSGVLTAFAFASAIIALSFMAGEGFSMPSIRSFAKNEAYELMVSAIILIIAISLITQDGPFDMTIKGFMLSGIPPDRACSHWKTLHGPYDPLTQTYANGSVAFAQADYFLGCRPGVNITAILDFEPGKIIESDGVVLRKLSYGYMSLMMTEMIVGFLSSLSTGVSIPMPAMPLLKIDVGVVPWIGMTQVNDIHTLLVDLVGQLWAAFAAQKLLLLFIEEAALPVFLPFGLLLRAFPFSRKTGSTVIAVVFAAYFVYPTTILINQRIWEGVANPTDNPHNEPTGLCVDPLGNAVCCQLAVECLSDSDCCSNDCRFSGVGPLKECVSPLTDFTKYSTLYSVCYGSKTPDQINAQLQLQAYDYNQGMQNVYFSGSATSSTWTQTQGKLQDFWSILKQKAVATVPVAEAIAIQDPRKVVTNSFAMVEMLVMDIMQFAMMAALFIVIEIVITATLMKDFALLIGGEPRVLGISQLV